VAESGRDLVLQDRTRRHRSLCLLVAADGPLWRRDVGQLSGCALERSRRSSRRPQAGGSLATQGGRRGRAPAATTGPGSAIAIASATARAYHVAITPSTESTGPTSRAECWGARCRRCLAWRLSCSDAKGVAMSSRPPSGPLLAATSHMDQSAAAKVDTLPRRPAELGLRTAARPQTRRWPLPAANSIRRRRPHRTRGSGPLPRCVFRTIVITHSGGT